MTFFQRNRLSGRRFGTTSSTESTKNIPGGNKQRDQDYTDTRMYDVPNSNLCPVNGYEKYVEKLHEDNMLLFQKAAKNFVFDARTWYTKEVLGKNTVGDMMKTLSKKDGLSKMYTNHCIRATTVTNYPLSRWC